MLGGVVLTIFDRFYVQPQKYAVLQRTVDAMHEHAVQLIPINNDSTIAKDIEYIQYDKKNSKITVLLKQQRRCVTPYLVGRLSGPTLAKVQWEQHENAVVGHFHLFEPGVYFVEIIVINCDAELTNNMNFEEICLEDPKRHRITEKNSTITALTKFSGSEALTNPIGAWYFEGDERPKQVYTRYQPAECFQLTDNIPVSCNNMAPLDLTRFDPYKFKFASDLDLKDHLKGKEGRVCYVGASHGNMLAYHTSKILNEIQNINVTVDYCGHCKGKLFVAKYAEYLTKPSVIRKIIKKNCTKVVIGTGQWDASSQEGHPTSFKDYESHLKVAMELLLSMLGQNNIELYFRSTHYIPINAKTSACPPIDWRNPPVIDKYNEITKRLCKFYNITLFDTNDIVGVTWDRAKDWSHLNNTSGKIEAE
uniref:Uncharacterized protein n=1 Tax=Leptocylindrus danicus TaxID=163516 RepID=A0A7S2LT61_9STRA|mmetsp:Transcript_9665/g.14525  ORF Transcript_9665/g.14525 Transcript_9665/m.14525 type:complete len:420 (+) Transcript_9665:3-1262(+)